MSRFFSYVNQSVLKTVFHKTLFQNRALVRALGIRVPRVQASGDNFGFYGDLTTVLLARTLRTLVPRRRVARAHEIGCGFYAISCIWMKRRFPHVRVTGSTIAPKELACAERVLADNGLAIDLTLSDLLTDVEGTFDLVWWNLPYYAPNVLDLVDRLLAQAIERQALTEKGAIVLGFNGVPLPLAKVLAIGEKHAAFRVAEVRSFRWNPHHVVVFERV